MAPRLKRVIVIMIMTYGSDRAVTIETAHDIEHYQSQVRNHDKKPGNRRSKPGDHVTSAGPEGKPERGGEPGTPHLGDLPDNFPAGLPPA